MDCSVVVEAAVPVYDVETADEAVRIAVSKTGGMLNPDLSFVEIEVRPRPCSACGEPHDPAFVAADEALVALALEMEVYNVEREEHAARVARKEIGGRLADIPLRVLEVVPVGADEGPESAEEGEPEGDVAGTEDEDVSEEDGADRKSDADDLLPDLEELVDEPPSRESGAAPWLGDGGG